MLVAPSGALNLGSVARVMRNFGLDDLRLVKPQVPALHDDAKRMAMRSVATLERASQQTFDTLGQALHSIHTVVATTSRRRGPAQQQDPLLPGAVFGEGLSRLLPGPGQHSAEGTAFVFGNEESGLSNDDLAHAHLLMKLPSDPEFPSLNLAQAVGIVCYEMVRSGWWPPVPYDGRVGGEVPTHGRGADPIACADDVEDLLLQVSSLLIQAGFLLPHTQNARMNQIARLLRRARPTHKELSLLGAIVRFVHRRSGSETIAPTEP